LLGSQDLAHETGLIPAVYVTFVKQQKNDMADAEAICEAAQRPTMRFVRPKSAEAQGAAVAFRTRRPVGPSEDPTDQCAARSPRRVRLRKNPRRDSGPRRGLSPDWAHNKEEALGIEVLTPLQRLGLGEHSGVG